MKGLARKLVVSSLAMSLVGCVGATKQDMGVVTGGLVGGLLGSQFGGGTGQIAATMVGTMAGAFLGGNIGKSMDEQDRARMTRVIETAPTGRTVSWRNPDTGNRYQITPTKTYSSYRSQPCREYTSTAIIGGKREQVYGTACRQADGSWKITHTDH